MRGIKALLFDWGNTLMADIPGMAGPMADWPEVYLMPGVGQTLPRLAAKYLCAVATGAADSTEEQIREAFARAGIDAYVQRYFLARDMGLEKFQPEYYARIAGLLRLAPEEITMIGDDYERDIMPAKSAGLQTILIQTMPGRYPNADAVVSQFTQLALFIEA